ncbi:plastocyanin/azurin family copper-binding protein [uncultured Tateyamaria sp.]|uniref:plastocyanin/azurin family copper-binding protein n=1 Tax=uncultured Tateyamaria sp. TaxID=455651 RepID=UPI002639FB37|nr:plastocyanin/azurin family copper-binding protein [uncultured Tateyamaria sp.]
MTALVTRRKVIAGVAATSAALAMPGSVLAAPTAHEVRIKRFAFVPDRIQVRVGDTVRWINEDLAPHTATAESFDWDTGEIVRNQSAEVIVTAEMDTQYFCVFHPHMKGAIELV